jgi:hypothetical protein
VGLADGVEPFDHEILFVGKEWLILSYKGGSEEVGCAPELDRNPVPGNICCDGEAAKPREAGGEDGEEAAMLCGWLGM